MLCPEENEGKSTRKSIEVKTKVAKYVAEKSVKATVMKLQGQVPNAPKIWKNTVLDWKNAYLHQLERPGRYCVAS